VVKIFACLELEQNWAFFKDLKLSKPVRFARRWNNGARGLSGWDIPVVMNMFRLTSV